MSDKVEHVYGVMSFWLNLLMAAMAVTIALVFLGDSSIASIMLLLGIVYMVRCLRPRKIIIFTADEFCVRSFYNTRNIALKTRWSDIAYVKSSDDHYMHKMINRHTMNRRARSVDIYDSIEVFLKTGKEYRVLLKGFLWFEKSKLEKQLHNYVEVKKLLV